MNDQAIFEQLAQHPKSRAVQIADRLDCDVDDVQTTLSALIAVGEVTASNGSAPNNTPCQVYELSERFKESDAFPLLEAKAAAMRFAMTHANLSRIDRAVEFVRGVGVATSAELHIVMGLAPEEYASVILSHTLRAERLAKDGKNWVLGPKAGAASEVQDTAAGGAMPNGAMLGVKEPLPVLRPIETPKEQPKLPVKPPKQEVPTPNVPAQTGTAAAPPPAPAPKKSRCRFAIWSDNLVEIKVPGNPSLELSLDEVDQLSQFVAARRGAVA